MIIFKRRCALSLICSLEKSQVTKELALITLFLARLVAQYNSYGGLKMSYYTVYPIVGIVQLVFAICFCTLFLHQCTNNCIPLIVKIVYITHNSLVFFTYLWISHSTGFHFSRGPTI